jgi:hypothetical protein
MEPSIILAILLSIEFWSRYTFSVAPGKVQLYLDGRQRESTLGTKQSLCCLFGRLSSRCGPLSGGQAEMTNDHGDESDTLDCLWYRTWSVTIIIIKCWGDPVSRWTHPQRNASRYTLRHSTKIQINHCAPDNAVQATYLWLRPRKVQKRPFRNPQGIARA